ncbi:hypothetical protein ACFLRO_01960 [Bacteroidota bacterium]
MIYFGDIHNHNGLGYGKGSLERSIEIARSHLDFFAFTGHSSWHDMPTMEGGREQHWIDGFARFSRAWSDVRRLTAEANRRDEFVALLGFEWHSSAFGDQCILFPDDNDSWVRPDHIEGLRAFARERNALMIPHHLSYPTGHRGVNWDVFTEECTPVVEIYSEHGSAEDDRGPYAYFNHSLGPRVTANTVEAALKYGRRFGFTASSDSHRGFPGAWDEGVTGVHADELSRAGIADAIRSRRTYALTGDRIEINFEVDGAPMGASLDQVDDVEATFTVKAPDALDVVEIVQDGRVVHRAWPGDSGPIDRQWLVRVEWGWGPWADMALDRIADWRFDIRLKNGEIENIYPCFRSGPFDENRRHHVVLEDLGHVSVRSYSGRRGAYRGNPNHSVILAIEADPTARIELDVQDPGDTYVSFSLEDLSQGGRALFTGPYPAECMLVHRPVFSSESQLMGRSLLKTGGRQSYAYLRVKQKNGQMAWASPVFMNHTSR